MQQCKELIRLFLGQGAQDCFCLQAGGSSYGVTTADVDDGDVDALVKSLIKEVSSNGVTDPFRGKGQKSFRANYLDM